ncbi:uncharacterized protein [Dysidea avara]|uniref:uncharacterized protein isoform X2 n=1 Tax=Dysidea avara TaxID=196820 RepID=UPI0033292C89
METRRKRVDAVALLQGKVDVRSKNDVAESRDTTTIATAAIATDTTTTAVATDTTTSTTAAVATETDTTTVGTRTTATVAVTNFSDTHSVYYEVERVLATNKKKNQPRQFLVKWRNYPTDQAGWVSEKDCTQEVLRQFYIEDIPEAVVMDHVNRLIIEVNKKLNSTKESCDKYIRIPFMHSVYYKLFGNRTHLRARDFNCTYFERGWDQSFDRAVGRNRTIYSGSKVIYPIVMYLYHTSSKDGRFCRDVHTCTYSKKSVAYNDMLRIFVNKKDCK